jgi:hypothetical protein
MANTLTLVQLLCVVLLLVAAPIYECLKLKWRAEEAERIASNERLRCKRLEREVAYLQHVVQDLQCSALAPASLSVASDAAQRIAQNPSEDVVAPNTVTV